jgi:membrane associated rhomboid family serine protease
MQNHNIITYIKEQFNTGGMIKRILLINVAVFVALLLIKVITVLFKIESYYSTITNFIFVMPGSFDDLIYRPWTMVTSLFTHEKFDHFFWNMLMFYFTSKLFVQLFTEKRLLSTYLLTGMFGSLIYMLSYVVFPFFNGAEVYSLIGASGAINGLIGAMIYYKPQLKIKLFFSLEVPFWLIGLIFIGGDLLSLTSNDGIAHFAHLGGALFGVISVLNVDSPHNFMNKIDKILSTKLTFKKQPKMKVYRNSDASKMSDDQYNVNKVTKQKQMDAILDKISSNGYESLSKKEKDFLFKFGNE